MQPEEPRVPPRVSEEQWCLVRQEAVVMSTIMRQNVRFNGASKVVGEHRLLKGFVDIRRRLSPDDGAHAAIAPFLEVVKSADTTSTESAAALQSLSLLVDRGVVKGGKELREVVDGALGCQFQQSDVTVDDVVISRMFELLVKCFESPASSELDGDLVVETVRLVMKASLEIRFTEALRMNAEISLSRMISCICTRLSQLVGE
eukprot:CAMPEP_0181328512 /NCGR_PEP_ID=MMETSP1101-20121128/22765_1 /TAXON_ID=46948 /ORGANISM="Rhodomonas abbreviata, Strain Caron Lab Isolate" /LENGTH=202 /DNA_ID=CAMNT_0023437425 /DNA_START=195 /DNA_END=800 /DNA_ORIENTATION=+